MTASASIVIQSVNAGWQRVKASLIADALESGQQFEIMIAGERISVPVRARFNIEHEREGGEEEIEFQVKWEAE